MTPRSRSCVTALLLFLGAVAVARAQTALAAVRGAVRAAGAPIPGAAVELLDPTTTRRRVTTANDAGEYAFGGVAPGTYTLRASAPGLQMRRAANVVVGADQVAIVDLDLAPAVREEEITVAASDTVGSGTNPAVDLTLAARALETLPTAGRNVFVMVAAAPSVLLTGEPEFVRQQDQSSSSAITVAGAPSRSSAYTLDGVPITDLRNRAAIIPGIEATAEAQLSLATSNAAIGRTAGGVFSVITRGGTNAWHGGLLAQARPGFLQSRLYFDARACAAARREGRACAPEPDTSYHLLGASLGGPLRRDRTFVHASFEGYRSRSARNAIITLPTARERQGDFSASGITIYDPETTRPDGHGGVTRDPFPGNVIPPERIDPVARAFLEYMPLPTDGHERVAAVDVEDVAKQAIVRLDNRFSARVQSSLTAAWYASREPDALLFGGAPSENPGDPADATLFRSVVVLALNTTIAPSANSSWTLRYGFTRFSDANRTTPFDPRTLGFADEFVSALPAQKFPQVSLEGFGSLGGAGLVDALYYSHAAALQHTRLLGRHALKLGAEYRRFGLDLFAAGQPSGRFTFTSAFTSGPDPLAAAAGSGSSVASFLLGHPARGDVTVASRNHFFITYAAAFLQDELRLGSRLTLSGGLRVEWEQGLREENGQLTVGFDRDRPWPFQVEGVTLRGGLEYAGRDGYPLQQGGHAPVKVAPRAGFAWSPGAHTTLRGALGRFSAPIQYGYPDEGRLGNRGFTAITEYVASTDGGLTPCPGCTFANPFPAGIGQPRGAADGITTGAGGTISFVDQERSPPRVDHLSLAVEQRVAGAVTLSLGYTASRGRDLSYGGSEAGAVNVNQLPVEALALGPALFQPVPNPFFGDPRFGALALSETVPRAQLLRPYPQFGDVYAYQVSGARSRYHAVDLRLQRPLHGGWGGDVSYTRSWLKDDLFAEGSFASAPSGAPRDNRDLAAEWSVSLRDTPHRLSALLAVELPFARTASRRSWARALVRDWTIGVAASYQSGFPLSVVMLRNETGLTGVAARPNVTGLPAATTGSTEERLDRWLDPAAYAAPAPFTLGNAPRTDGSVRGPSRRQVDLAVQRTLPAARGARLTLRAEVINLMGDALFRSPATQLGSRDFGRITSVAGFPRLLQASARLAF